MLQKDEHGPGNASNAKIATGNVMEKLGESHTAECKLKCHDQRQPVHRVPSRHSFSSDATFGMTVSVGFAITVSNLGQVP